MPVMCWVALLSVMCDSLHVLPLILKIKNIFIKTIPGSSAFPGDFYQYIQETNSPVLILPGHSKEGNTPWLILKS